MVRWTCSERELSNWLSGAEIPGTDAQRGKNQGGWGEREKVTAGGLGWVKRTGGRKIRPQRSSGRGEGRGEEKDEDYDQVYKIE